MTIFFSCAGALILANIYYAQPILADMAADIGLAPAASGSILTLLQIGYMLGILFMGPLGDALENRRLIAGMVLGPPLRSGPRLQAAGRTATRSFSRRSWA